MSCSVARWNYWNSRRIQKRSDAVLAALERAYRIALDRFKADSAVLATKFKKDAALKPVPE